VLLVGETDSNQGRSQSQRH